MNDCQDTVLEILPDEIRYLEHYSKMRQFIEEHFDIPDNKIAESHRFSASI